MNERYSPNSGENKPQDQISREVSEYFIEKQVFKKNVGRDAFNQRLQELAEGRTVPVVIFNCLDFGWVENGNNYPMSSILSDTSTSICVFFEDRIIEAIDKLQEVGKPDLRIIVPDSELFDTRPFAFAQSLEERKALADRVSEILPQQFPTLTGNFGNRVCLWSQYCRDYGLQSPFAYTTDAYELISSNPELENAVRKQVKDSKNYLIKNGLSLLAVLQIPEDELFERVKWYCAMYIGEGRALADSGAIVLNFEDGRIPKWFQRGANEQLTILTPADPNKFYEWRSNQKK
ncbi:MAG: hypothetical protein WD988_05115 [Candidatus Curtissbacteria bacterium]